MKIQNFKITLQPPFLFDLSVARFCEDGVLANHYGGVYHVHATFHFCAPAVNVVCAYRVKNVYLDDDRAHVILTADHDHVLEILSADYVPIRVTFRVVHAT